MNKKTFIQLPGGRRFWPLKAEGPIVLSDIAGALSKINRYTGHTTHAYSVALHSVNVARVLPDELKLWGLLHDASEAYLGDVARPIKYPWWMWPYRRAEDRLLRRIADEFGLCWPVPPEVKEADNRMLATEVRHLFKTLHPDWETWLRGIEPYADAPTSWFEEQSPRSVQHLYEFYVGSYLEDFQ